MKVNLSGIAEKSAKLKWWHIVLISVAMTALGGLSSGIPNTKERKLYDRDLKQAPWAPPGWLFAPAWTLNNIFILLALQKLLTSNVPQKKKLLILQGLIWFIFFTFGYVYFNRKSSVLAAVWTVSDAALSTASVVIASRSKTNLFYYYLPLTAWTVFASTVALYQALENPDPVLNTEALL
jgi:tryptophan-rich sensory protein